MLSWNDDLPSSGKFGSMARAGSLTKAPASPGARRSVELNNVGSVGRRSSLETTHSVGSPKHSPLVKEGQKFDGWSRLVDHGHMNVCEPANDPAPKPIAMSEPVKQQVGGFDELAARSAAPSAPASAAPAPDVTSPAASAQPAVPAAVPAAVQAGGEAFTAGAEADGKGWWKKMDQGVLNMKHTDDVDGKKPTAFTPQFGITGQSRDLDWGDSGVDSAEKKVTDWQPFKQ